MRHAVNFFDMQHFKIRSDLIYVCQGTLHKTLCGQSEGKQCRMNMVKLEKVLVLPLVHRP